MEVLLLAAGLGRRLGALTERAPKALIRVAGETLLGHAMRFAARLQPERILVVGGASFAAVAEEVAQQRSGLPVPVQLLENSDYQAGNLLSLLVARSQLVEGDGAFVLLNVDHLFPPSAAEALRVAAAQATSVTACVDEDRPLGADDMKVTRTDTGRVRAIDKQLTLYDAGYVGVTIVPGARRAAYFAEAETTRAQEGDAAHVERVLARLAATEEAPATHDLSGHGWYEVDTPEDLARAEAALNAAASHVVGTREIPAPVLLRATSEEAKGAGLRVAGLTVLERAVRQLRQAGRTVLIASDGSCALPEPLPEGVRVVAARDHSGRSSGIPTSTAILAADVVRPSFGATFGGTRVTDEPSRRHAEDAVFADLLRADLGWVARHLNKPLSFRLTRHVLCRLPVTPNQVTIGAGLLGLAGALLLATGRAPLLLAGLLLAHLQSVLDGCDGELARVRFQTSRLGAWLDTVVDDLLNVALIAGLGVGLGRQGVPWAPAVGLGAAGLLLFHDAVAYRELIRQGSGGDLFKLRWWFAGGRDLRTVYATRRGPVTALLLLGRRDFVLVAWFALALVGALPVALVHAAVLAITAAVAALGQVARGGRGAVPTNQPQAR